MSDGSPAGVLILSLSNWFGTARLPRAFQEAGFHVSTLAYPGLLIGQCRHVDRALFIDEDASDQQHVSRVLEVLRSAPFRLVVPGDDGAVDLLHSVTRAALRADAADQRLLGLLRDSTGRFEQHATLRSRKALAAFVAQLGLRAPAHSVATTAEQARQFAEQQGLQVVFKAEESFAGLGVSICQDAAALDAALGRLSAAPGGLAQGVLAQSFVPGKTAMRALIAWRGRVLAGLSAIKRETHPNSTGPSSVVEFIEHPEMSTTAEALIAALGYSGFASLDFILDADNAAHLIELNPRPTPICHLGGLFGADLCQSLQRALGGEELAPPKLQGVPRKVALFPQEWVRCSRSPHFTDALHDVPWDEPALLEAYVALGRSHIRFGGFRTLDARRHRWRQELEREAAEPARR